MTNSQVARLERALTKNLSPDLLTPAWRKSSTGPLSGHCYVASEAAWHLLGAMDSPWRPYVGRVGDVTHWWLQDGDTVLDITLGQFPQGFNHSLGHKCGFLTREPSKRARILIERSGLRPQHSK